MLPLLYLLLLLPSLERCCPLSQPVCYRHEIVDRTSRLCSSTCFDIVHYLNQSVIDTR